jgi:hypothetical protein
MNQQNFSEILEIERCKRIWRKLTFDQREQYRKFQEEKAAAYKSRNMALAGELHKTVLILWKAFGFPREIPLSHFALDDPLKTREQLEVHREGDITPEWKAFIREM